mmetsp:Transcript_20182/g.65549  ORF Transcript_20182/g.65549 Transcript_20182/m.65549 type:complete len:138 (+) Transcript_20182:183-596(+)
MCSPARGVDDERLRFVSVAFLLAQDPTSAFRPRAQRMRLSCPHARRHTSIMMRVVIFVSLFVAAVLAAPLVMEEQAQTPRLLSETNFFQDILSGAIDWVVGQVSNILAAVLPNLPPFLANLLVSLLQTVGLAFLLPV